MVLYEKAKQIDCPHFDARPDESDIDLLVIHNISLPPEHFGSGDIRKFFTGKLDPNGHPFYQHIAHIRVSAHCVIYRTGEVEQFVPFNHRAWHAGVSVFQGRHRCNDFSIGVELEGTDDMAYTHAQYQSLIELTRFIRQCYPRISLGRIVGHNDIAPGRKSDPGEAFDWARYRTAIDA